MLDELRQCDWLPRGVRRSLREAEKMISKLEQKKGRAPTEAELAAAVAAGTLDLGVDGVALVQEQAPLRGGHITRAAKPAYCAATIERRTLNDRLTASGTLAQLLPPSLVLIVLGVRIRARSKPQP